MSECLGVTAAYLACHGEEETTPGVGTLRSSAQRTEGPCRPPPELNRQITKHDPAFSVLLEERHRYKQINPEVMERKSPTQMASQEK